MMERAEWLKQMRGKVESLYDHISPEYWANFGFYPNETHLEFLRIFLARVPAHSTLLSAACGAGRYDGMLLEAGHEVVGIDQSEGMLRRAREHFPEAQYKKMGLQEINFIEAFEGAICMDALENVCPEDWPGIMQGFQRALKPGGLLYFTVEQPDTDLQASYERAQAMGLPVVFGELADEVDASFEQVMEIHSPGIPGELVTTSVYHYYPSREQVQAWLEQAGLVLEEQGTGNGYIHFLAKKR
jgi:SAM-dependent methyltransferase